jgi:hypothetical protein
MNAYRLAEPRYLVYVKAVSGPLWHVLGKEYHTDASSYREVSAKDTSLPPTLLLHKLLAQATLERGLRFSSCNLSSVCGRCFGAFLSNSCIDRACGHASDNGRNLDGCRATAAWSVHVDA